MPRSLEDFELLNTKSQLQRAAEHAFDFYQGAISQEECLRVAEDSHRLLAQSAKVTHHLIPLSERWTIERLRRYGILARRLAQALPEVMFVDQDDSAAAPIAAALLTSYARGRVNVSSAGHTPGASVDGLALQVLEDSGVEAKDSFAKPITDDALQAADIIVVIGDVPPLPTTGASRTQQHLYWDLPDPQGEPLEVLQSHRDELDRNVLRLLADILDVADVPDH